VIPSWKVFDVRISQDARCGDAGSKLRWKSCRWGGKSEGGVFFLFLCFFFFFFYNQVFVVKVQETTWRASYGRNKTTKQSNGPLHFIMGQTNTPHP